MISISGIRGIVGEDLNPLSVMNFTDAFISSIDIKNKKIAVARDSRKSGKMIKSAVTSVLTGLGLNVLDLGIAPTPTSLYATRNLQCDGGIIITASHNPIEWNALKLSNNRGLFLDGNTIERIKKRARDNSRTIEWVDVNNLGKIEDKKSYPEKYIDDILEHFNVEAIRAAGFKIVYDPVGGAASILDRYFFERLNCNAIPINDSITGDFPRDPEPTPRNLRDLSEKVKKHNADIGFAQDPDADRLVVVEDGGEVLSEEFTLVLAGESYLRKQKTDIACNLSTTMLIDYLAEKYGVSVSRTRIGEAFVTEELLKKGLGFGGEGNGGVIVPSINPARDSFVGMSLILELLATTGQRLSDIVKEFPSFSMIKDKIILEKPVRDREQFYSLIKDKLLKYFNNYNIITIDGIKLERKDEWIHVRLSNTEPQIRIVVETEDEVRSAELLKMIKDILENIDF